VPFELRCESRIDGRRCEGFARSQFYDLGGGDLIKRPTHIFYWPKPADLKTWFDRWRFANGQLFLRRIV
jgi:hypothetical protein